MEASSALQREWAAIEADQASQLDAVRAQLQARCATSEALSSELKAKLDVAAAQVQSPARGGFQVHARHVPALRMHAAAGALRCEASQALNAKLKAELDAAAAQVRSPCYGAAARVMHGVCLLCMPAGWCMLGAGCATLQSVEVAAPCTEPATSGNATLRDGCVIPAWNVPSRRRPCTPAGC
jgi:hypothetical protein